MPRGGKRENAGRPKRVDEAELMRRLDPLVDSAFEALNKAVLNREAWAIKLFFEYWAGKPLQRVDMTTDGEQINRPNVVTTLTPDQLKEYLKK